MKQAVSAGKLPGAWRSPKGQEAVGVGACTFLRKDDYVSYCHRGDGLTVVISKGFSPKTFIAEHYSKATGGSFGIAYYSQCDMELGIPGISTSLGGDFAVVTGIGFASKMSKKGQVVVCIKGDGEYTRGTFHEAMLLAANERLPVVWGIENNQYMITSHVSEIYPRENMADLALGYGVPGVIVDGQDVFAVCAAFHEALERARAGKGPTIIECKTYRVEPMLCGQADMRGTKTRSREEIEPWLKKDPIDLCQERLLKEGVLTEGDVERINNEATKEMEEAERFAVESPPPNPNILSQLNQLYCH